MKTLTLAIFLLSTTVSYATEEFVVAKPTEVYELNHGKGKVQCTLKRNTKVKSDWANHKWSFIQTKTCKGWVESKYLKS